MRGPGNDVEAVVPTACLSQALGTRASTTVERVVICVIGGFRIPG